MDIPVLFEDTSLVVLDKPVGVSVTEDGENTTARDEGRPTVKKWVKDRYTYSDCKSGKEGEFEQRFGIVHRLDKETSGILVVAKNKEVFDYLKGLFKFRRIEKTYQALVYGVVNDDNFEINAPVARDQNIGTAFGVDEFGRQSLTNFKVVDRYTIDSFGFGATYLFAYPKTGRTHQIRVHLKAFGHPVVNDYKYASRNFLELSKGLPTRMMLHAKCISFIDWDGKKRDFMSHYNLSDLFKNQVFPKNI